MAEVENLKVENNSVEAIKVVLNKDGEYIMISPDDATMFDRFATGIRQIVTMANEMPKKLGEIEKQYKGKTDHQSRVAEAIAISRENVNFSREAVKIIDEIFGEDTIKKYFRDIYSKIPDFLPSSDCIIDFFEQITPPMEEIFNRKLNARDKLSKQRMDRYQPQDHKKPQRKK